MNVDPATVAISAPAEPAAPPNGTPPTVVLSPELRASIDRQVQEAVTKARREEKEKLYATLEEDRQKRQAAEKELEELKNKLADQQAQGDPVTRTQKEMISQLQQQIERLTRDLELQRQQMEDARKRAEDEAHKQSLEAYKNRRLRELSEARIGVIADMLGGNSEQEIEQSIERAAAVYRRIVEQADADKLANRAAVPLAGSPSSGPTTGVPTQPPGPRQELTAAQINSMSPEEYARHREEVLKSSGVPVSERLVPRR